MNILKRDKNDIMNLNNKLHYSKSAMAFSFSFTELHLETVTNAFLITSAGLFSAEFNNKINLKAVNI